MDTLSRDDLKVIQHYPARPAPWSIRWEVMLPDGWNYTGCHSLCSPNAKGRDDDIKTLLKFAEKCSDDCDCKN